MALTSILLNSQRTVKRPTEKSDPLFDPTSGKKIFRIMTAKRFRLIAGILITQEDNFSDIQEDNFSDFVEFLESISHSDIVQINYDSEMCSVIVIYVKEVIFVDRKEHDSQLPIIQSIL